MKLLLTLAGVAAIAVILIGACSTQSFIMAAPRDNTIRLFKTGSGKGNIRSESNGILCNETCTETVEIAIEEGSIVTFVAEPLSGSEFAGWSGPCKGRSRTCTLIVGSQTRVTAKFNLIRY